MVDQVTQGLAAGVALDVDLGPHGGEPERLWREVAYPPYRRNVDIPFELEFDFVQRDAAGHGIGVDADRETRAQSGQEGFCRVGRGVVPEQGRGLIDHVRWQRSGCSSSAGNALPGRSDI